MSCHVISYSRFIYQNRKLLQETDVASALFRMLGRDCGWAIRKTHRSEVEAGSGLEGHGPWWAGEDVL